MRAGMAVHSTVAVLATCRHKVCALVSFGLATERDKTMALKDERGTIRA